METKVLVKTTSEQEPVTKAMTKPSLATAIFNSENIRQLERLELVTYKLQSALNNTKHERLENILERPSLKPLKLYLNEEINASQAENQLAELFLIKHATIIPKLLEKKEQVCLVFI